MDVLRRFLAQRRDELLHLHPALPPLVDELAAAVEAGGKRIRPWFLGWGYRAAGCTPDDSIAAAGAALELLHTFALVQDDIIDASPVRRGRPASHVRLASLRPGPPSEAFGRTAALLMSDLALVWSDRLLFESGFEGRRLAEGLRVFSEMRTEMTAGEYLDVLAVHDEAMSEREVLDIYRLKTAAYTVERPIQLGMALAGAPADLLDAIPPYARPAGMAFQLRDDLLGAFGDPKVTGKPRDDLAIGKPTWLLARALARAAPEVRHLILKGIRAGLAEPEDTVALREMIHGTGAVEDAEALIGAMGTEAMNAIAGLAVEDGLRTELAEVTERLLWRTS